MIYEVRCYDCDVSFPPGTKKCFHCGGRLHAEPPGALAAYLGGSQSFGEAGPFSEADGPEGSPQSDAAPMAEEPEARQGFNFGRLGIWIALGLGTAIVRACGG